jgi:shikimate dehydrogenase
MMWVLGLTGFPLDHSLSPMLHDAALKALGLQGEYRLYPIQADDVSELNSLLKSMRSRDFQGLNVTVPHKRTVIPLLDKLSPLASAVGAVNTIYLRDGRLSGENTDVSGFLQDLDRCISGQTAGEALVLGGGGASRSVCYSLLSRGWKVVVAARNPGQAEQLAFSMEKILENTVIQPTSLDAQSLEIFADRVDLLVNTTPLGMGTYTDQSPWPDEIPLPRGAVIYDLVYNPRETLLMRRAQAAGLRAFCGLGMLVEQAALSFSLWTGKAPPREEMQSILEEIC